MFWSMVIDVMERRSGDLITVALQVVRFGMRRSEENPGRERLLL